VGITIKQIATEVGLSWPAVSQILNNRGRFAADTREKVLAAASKHGYRPNSSARALRKQSSKLIGVLFRNDPQNTFTNMVAFESLLGINQRFQEADYSTILIRAGELAAGNDTDPRVFRERLVDGVIVVGAVPKPLLDRVTSLSQRVIWLDTDFWTDTCCVRRDEHAAGYECVQRLADLGYSKVTYVSREPSRLAHHSHRTRELGARQAAQNHGVQLDSIHWPEGDRELEYRALRDSLNSEIGIVAGSLPIARRIFHGAQEVGKSAGYDYGMVCCDDSFDTYTTWKGLSRVIYNRYHLGGVAADMMLKLLDDPANPPASHLKKEPWIAGYSAWGPTIGSRPGPE
jgi:LacI family transcriptional regulator